MKQRERKHAAMHGDAGRRRLLASRIQGEADRFPIQPFMYRLTRRKRVVPIYAPLADDLEIFGNLLGRKVGEDIVGDVEVSTVFLVIAHGVLRKDFFETAVISRGAFEIVRRYKTWNEAKAGHAEVVKALREGRDYERYD